MRGSRRGDEGTTGGEAEGIRGEGRGVDLRVDLE